MQKGYTKITQLCTVILANSFFSPSSFSVASYIHLIQLIGFLTYLLGHKTQFRGILLFPRIAFSYLFTEGFWVVKLSAVWKGQKYKWAQKISKQINRKVYCPLWLLCSGLLLSVHKSPCQYLLSGRAEHFLSFSAFTTGHCQWKSLKPDTCMSQSGCSYPSITENMILQTLY